MYDFYPHYFSVRHMKSIPCNASPQDPGKGQLESELLVSCCKYSCGHRWRRMVQQYLHDSLIHTNVLKFSHTCQLTVLNFSGILHWYHRLLSPLHIRPTLCCVVAVVLDIQCGEEKISKVCRFMIGLMASHIFFSFPHH